MNCPNCGKECKVKHEESKDILFCHYCFHVADKITGECTALRLPITDRPNDSTSKILEGQGLVKNFDREKHGSIAGYLFYIKRLELYNLIRDKERLETKIRILENDILLEAMRDKDNLVNQSFVMSGLPAL